MAIAVCTAIKSLTITKKGKQCVQNAEIRFLRQTYNVRREDWIRNKDIGVKQTGSSINDKINEQQQNGKNA